MEIKILKERLENYILSLPLLPKKYSHLLLLLSLAFFSTECAQKKAGGLGGSSGGATTTTTSGSTTNLADTAISYTQSTITVSAGTINHGDTATVYATFKNAAGSSLDLPSETLSFSLTGGGTASGTFSSPQYDAGNKRWYSTFTGSTAGTAKNIYVTHDVNGSPQALTSTLPSITVNALSAPTVTLSMDTARSGSNPFDVFITFSRAVTGFENLAGGVTASNTGGYSITNPVPVNGSATVYKVTVTPNDTSDVTLTVDKDVLSGVVADNLGYAIDSNASYIARLISMGFSNISDNGYYNSQSVNGYCTSAAANSAIYWRLNSGVSNQLTCTADAWNTNFSFTEGLNTLDIYQLDSSNTNISATINIYYDTTAPTMQFRSIANGYQQSDNINDSLKSAITVTGTCSDALSPNASVSVTLMDASNNNYGPYSANCGDGGNTNNFTIVADMSAMTVGGLISASGTITDAAGNTGSDSRGIGTYVPSGNLQNLREHDSRTCLGYYCSPSVSVLNFEGECYNISGNDGRINYSVKYNGSEIAASYVNCSSGTFGYGLTTSGINTDGSYSIEFTGCSSTYECDTETLNFTFNNTNDCWSTGSGSSCSQDPATLSNSCTQCSTYNTTQCDDGSSSSTTTGISEVCSCTGGSNSYYSNFNDNAGGSACSATNYSESWSSSTNCMGSWNPYTSTWDNGLGCSCQNTGTFGNNTNESVSCGQSITVQGGSTYTCGSDSSVLNGCWRCTDNISSNPTDCANNTSATPSGRTWYQAYCSHSDGMGSPYNDESSCTSNTHSSGYTWGFCSGAPEYTNEYDCTLNGQTWTVACTDGSSLDQPSCETDPNVWYAASCSSGGYGTQYTCENDITSYSWVKNGW
jgi:hypothetical protein